MLDAIQKLFDTLDDEQKQMLVKKIKQPVKLSEIKSECKEHSHGVTVDHGGELLFFDEDFQVNPMRDTRFDFCPFCGERLEKEVI